MVIVMPDSTNDVIEVWADTGRVVAREFTPEELAQHKADEKAAKEQAKQETARAEVRAAAVAHAKTLGFTAEMIAAMYPGLAEPAK